MAVRAVEMPRRTISLTWSLFSPDRGIIRSKAVAQRKRVDNVES